MTVWHEWRPVVPQPYIGKQYLVRTENDAYVVATFRAGYWVVAWNHDPLDRVAAWREIPR